MQVGAEQMDAEDEGARALKTGMRGTSIRLRPCSSFALWAQESSSPTEALKNLTIRNVTPTKLNTVLAVVMR